MTHIETLKLALEALEMWCPMTATYLNARDEAITALRRALAVSETHKQPAAPQRSEDKKQWVGLTTEEIYECDEKAGVPNYEITNADMQAFAFEIEAKLREKNNG